MKQETNTKKKGTKKKASAKKEKTEGGMTERKERTLRALGFIK